jgi:hypothetical protein
MKLRFLFSSLFVMFFIFCAPSNASSINFDFENNTIDRIKVGNLFYSVTFGGGTSCILTFDGCDNPEEDFAFQTAEAARTALEALWPAIDSIFNRSDLNFGSVCSSDWLSNATCKIVTPYGLGPVGQYGPELLIGALDVARESNSSGVVKSEISTNGPWFVDQLQVTGITYGEPHIFAKWVQVDEPSIYSLLMLSLGILFFARFKRRDPAARTAS